MKHRTLAALFAAAILTLTSCTAPPDAATPGVAVFDWFEYAGDDAWFRRDAPAGAARNPVLAGFYPDPSVVRVDDDYYLVNSTFAWYPGVPIFHSTDLVNWTQLGYVLDRPELLPVAGLGVSRGVFAPTIHYHDGLFYMITTMVDAGGNFYVTAEDPAGPWSDPVWLPDIPGIDPSFFVDDDGRVYIVSNGPPADPPRYQGHNAIWIQELNLETATIIGERKVIVDGGVDPTTNPIWVEGPHLYKLDGWYYLIAAEGGTEFFHSEVVFRSRDPFGPYEPGPNNPILTQRTQDPDRPFPVIATGHADMVETQNDEWWAVFLGCRPYDDSFYNTGRETFLHRVSWEDGWPMILDPSLPVTYAMDPPDLPTADAPSVPVTGNFTWRDEFESDDLALAWNSLRGPADDWLDFETIPGSASLTATTETLSGSMTPAFLARRLQHATFAASTRLAVPREPGLEAGLAVFQNESHHFFLGIRRSGERLTVFLEQAAGGAPAIIEERLIAMPVDDRIELRVTASGRPYAFSVRVGEGEWINVADDLDGSILSTVVAGGFVGAYVGLHARRIEQAH